MTHHPRPQTTAVLVAVAAVSVGLSAAGDCLAAGATSHSATSAAVHHAVTSLPQTTAHRAPAIAMKQSLTAAQSADDPSGSLALSPQGLNGGGASSAGACPGDAQVNCQARAKSGFSAAGGDPLPVSSVPQPSTIPQTPATSPVPDTTASEPAQPLEQSGGASGVVITQGGGPTLADCMALWEPAVHITKPRWKEICVRTMNGVMEPHIQ